MAAPVVTGTVALMLQANPTLTPNLIKAILQYTAQRTPGYNTLRAGRRLPQHARRGAPGAVLHRPRRPGQRYPIRAGRGASSIIWGNHRSAAASIKPNASAWKLGVVWGAAKPVVCGDNIVWGTTCGERLRQHRLGRPTRHGDNVVWGTCATATTSCGARMSRRRQHRLGHDARATTTSCGAPTAAAPTATTSCGAPAGPDARQHRVGHGAATATTSCGAPRWTRQRRLGHVERRRGQRHLGQLGRGRGAVRRSGTPSRSRSSASSLRRLVSGPGALDAGAAARSWRRSIRSIRRRLSRPSVRLASEASNHGKDALPRRELDGTSTP